MISTPKSSSIISAPGAPALFASSILARLPLAMFGIALLVHAQRLTGSFAAAPRSRGGSLGAPAIRTLVLVVVAVGAVFGAVDVGVTAAAKQLGSTAAAGPLLGLWGVGSLLGGVAATRLGGGARRARGLTLLLAVLALGHAALITATASALALGAVLVLAGASIAPTFAGIYAMVDKAAPAGTRTEAFAWLMTASSTGGSLGAVAAGALVQSAGASAAFALAGAAGALAVVIALLGSRDIGDAACERAVVVAPAVAV